MSNNRQYTIFVGNPGTGKSTLLNGLCPNAHFKSGISFGVGLTQTLQLAQISANQFYGDTPGLSDISRRKQAAIEIENSLKQNGDYRLIFVVTLEAGRVRVEDASTIKLILDAVTHRVPFGIIFNKLSGYEYTALTNPDGNDTDKKSVVSALLSSAPYTTNYFHCIKMNNELASFENNHYFPDDILTRLQSFLHHIPFISVSSNEVNAIDVRDFEKLSEELKKKMHDLHSNLLHLQSVYDSLNQKSEEDRKQLHQLLLQQQQVVVINQPSSSFNFGQFLLSGVSLVASFLL